MTAAMAFTREEALAKAREILAYRDRFGIEAVLHHGAITPAHVELLATAVAEELGEPVHDIRTAQIDELRRLLRDRQDEILRLQAVIRSDPKRRDTEVVRELRHHVELNGTMLRQERDKAARQLERIRKLEQALGRAGVALSRAGDLAEYSVAFAVLEGNHTALDAKEV